MGLASKELNSYLGNGFVPKTIAEFLQELSVTEDGKKLAKISGYVFELEQEMKKITVFKRELPVCVLLLGDAMDRLKQEVVRCKGRKMEAEKFTPSGSNSDGGAKESGDFNEKKNWMSSAQLWTTPIEYDNSCGSAKNQDSSTLHKKSMNNQECENGIGKRAQIESGNVKNRGAFMSFTKRCGGGGVDDLPGNGLSLSPLIVEAHYNEPRFSGPILQASPKKQQRQQEEQIQQQPKKPRRSWSPDLHRRFVSALSQLGGAQEATPKQIRELMQVPDLTNDEVKSHLQKYRVHVRKLASYGVSLDLNLDGLGREGGNSHKFKMAQPSCSPEGPLNLCGSSKGVSVSLTIGESMEEEEDSKSESFSWKGRARSR